MSDVMKIPVGSLVGMLLLAAVVGVIVGRSVWFMRKVGQMHAAAHGHGEAKAEAAATADQRVQTVVVVGADGTLRVDENGELIGGVPHVLRTGEGLYELSAWEAMEDGTSASGRASAVALEPTDGQALEAPETVDRRVQLVTTPIEVNGQRL